MSKPSLAEHDKRLALLERGAQHDAEHDEAVLKALQEIRDEMKALNQQQEARIKALENRQTEFDTAIKVATGTVRGIGMGWAAAFTFLGGGIVAVIGNVMGLFK